MFKLLFFKKVQLFIIIFLTFVTYSNIFANGFVSDDKVFIRDWKAKQSFSNLIPILGGAGPEERSQAVYRPIRGVFYVLYHQIFGVEPFGYHLNGIVVHILNTVLVYLIVEQLLARGSVNSFLPASARSSVFRTKLKQSVSVLRAVGNSSSVATPCVELGIKWLPFVTAFLFGLHPIHTEAITFMTSSMDIWGIVFLFASVWLYLLATQGYLVETKRQRDKGGRVNRGKYWLSVFFAGLAFFTNEITLILPLILISIDLNFGYGSFRKKFLNASSILKYSPYLVLTITYFVIRKFVFGFTTSLEPFLVDGRLNVIFFLIPKVILKYMELLVWPLRLSVNHIISPGFDTYTQRTYNFLNFKNSDFLDFQFIASCVVIAVLFGLAIYFWRKSSLIAFAIFWFFISVLPIANFFLQPTLLQERYVYLASFGWCFLAAYGVLFVISRKGFIGRIGLVGLVGFYAVVTFVRNLDWRSEVSLWIKAADLYPKSPISYFGVGNAYFEVANYTLAKNNYLTAVSILPNFANAHLKLATTYKKLGQEDLAVSEYRHVIEKSPEVLEAYLYLGTFYFKKGDFSNSLSILESGLQYKASYLDTSDHKIILSYIYALMGDVYQKMHQNIKAVQSYKAAQVLYSGSESVKQSLDQLTN